MRSVDGLLHRRIPMAGEEEENGEEEESDAKWTPSRFSSFGREATWQKKKKEGTRNLRQRCDRHGRLASARFDH